MLTCPICSGPVTLLRHWDGALCSETGYDDPPTDVYRCLQGHGDMPEDECKVSVPLEDANADAEVDRRLQDGDGGYWDEDERDSDIEAA